MASGVGVTYELEFVIKDKNAKQWIQSMQKEAERLAKALDKVTLNNFNKQLQHMQKHLHSQGDKLKSQLKTAQDMMKSLGTGKNVKSGLDNVKREAQEAKKKMDELNKAKEAVGKSVKDPLKNVAKGADSAMKKVKGLLNKVRDGALYKAGSFITQAGMEALQGYAQTDYELRGASAKTGGFGADLKEYRKLARQVGGATKFNNLDIAQAINAGATLGIKKDEMKQIIPSAANLAQAFNAELVPTLEMVKMHMNSYGLAGKDTQKVTDMIAMAAKSTGADLSRLAEGFKYVGASGKALGVPMESVYAMLGKLNDKQLLGSTAGTGLNQMFESLKDFKKRGKLEDLIGRVTDEKGNLQDVTSILERLKGVTDKMGNADKAGVLKTIFGVQGGRAVNSLLNSSIEDLKKLQNEIKNSSGIADILAKFMMQGSAGAVETLAGTISSMFYAIFDSLEPLLVPVAGLFMGIAEAIGQVAEKAPWLLQLVSVLGALVVGELVFQKLKASVGPFINGIKEAIASVSLLKLVLYGLLAVGLVVIFNLFKQWQDYLQENESVSKEWEGVLLNLTYALSALGDVIMSILGALFGFNTRQQDAVDKTKFMGMTAEEVTKKLKDFKKNIFDLTVRLQEMRRWVEENKEKIRLFGTVFLVLAAGVGILWALVTAQSAFNAVAALNPYVLIAAAIIGAIIAVVAVIKYFWDTNEGFRNAMVSIWNTISQCWAIVGFIFGGVVGAIIGSLLQLWAKNETFREFVTAVWNYISATFQLVGAIIGGIVMAIVNVISILVNAVINAYNTNSTFRAIVTTAWNVIGAVIPAVIGMIVGGPVGMFIGALVSLYTHNQTARNIINAAWNAIKSIVSSAISTIISRIQSAVSAVHGLISAFQSVGRLDLNGIKAGGSQFINGVKGVVTGQHKAVGTNNFQAQGGGGMTAIDEHGDEAIWLPNGSMVARNTTTLDMLNNLKSIKKNTRGGAKETGTVVTNNNHFVFNVNGTDETLQELKRELEKLGIV